jgi:NTP pyrophosphatase (non-canonical NTP hydrolase)
MALSVEASELAEIFMWLSEEESKNLTKSKLANLKEEIGDVMIYLINIANKFGLDPLDCAKQKLELNKTRGVVG